ncbi:MAG: S9 family peptidase [Candidatus Promineofilum sp.]|nr:S9 family peptidase [Promineifilum sp.]
MSAARIESLLSARLFQVPQLAGDRLYFVSNLSGRLSLYAMNSGGSVPEPLLPPHLALQNPHHVPRLFQVYPRLGQILLMLDHDGDENYQPMFVPLEGGYPEPVFGDALADYRVQLSDYDTERNMAYFFAESRHEPLNVAFRANLATRELMPLHKSMYGAYAAGANNDHTQVPLIEGYTVGDNVLYLWDEASGQTRLLAGRPLAERAPDEEVPLTSFGAASFVPGGRGLLLMTSLFEDTYGLGYLALDEPQTVARVEVRGVVHEGRGEMELLKHLRANRYAVQYNIDGCTWLYEGRFDADALEMRLDKVICGQAPLADGVMDSFNYDEASNRFVLSYSTATSPTQLYTVAGADRGDVARHTNERVLGLSADLLAPGEDASFTSHDGLRVSARLYLPSPALGYQGARPLIYYVHGGPQGQERPDFAWFSMPLIQFLTLNGFAVFVPNARGSTGYGLSYMKHVDHDWGGQDRLDHVHAMHLLAQDERLDTGRAAVIGRSYGGYMTLTLAARHPELWAAAVDMFGPYDMLTFLDRLPETWKPYFAIAVGDPVKDRDFLIERSPQHYIEQIRCPLLVIQGQNDPRVIERESRDVVERLRGLGKDVEYLVFPDEGHDVLKYENRVTCYNTITDFFRKHLSGKAEG